MVNIKDHLEPGFGYFLHSHQVVFDETVMTLLTMVCTYFFNVIKFLYDYKIKMKMLFQTTLTWV